MPPASPGGGSRARDPGRWGYISGTVTVRDSVRVRVTVSVGVIVRARVSLIAAHKGKAGDIIAHEVKVRGFDGDTVTAEVIIRW